MQMKNQLGTILRKCLIFVAKFFFNLLLKKGQMRIAGSMKSSTEVMKAMGNLIKLPELNKTMQELSKEMMKTGIIDEMINESIDNVLDDRIDVESAADEEIDKIILEVTQGKLKDLPEINKSLPVIDGASAAATADADEEEPEEEMIRRLETLRS